MYLYFKLSQSHLMIDNFQKRRVQNSVKNLYVQCSMKIVVCIRQVFSTLFKNTISTALLLLFDLAKEFIKFCGARLDINMGLKKYQACFMLRWRLELWRKERTDDVRRYLDTPLFWHLILPPAKIILSYIDHIIVQSRSLNLNQTIITYDLTTKKITSTKYHS